ncbi:MAG TPA: hypothetical protein VHF89_14000 [Solirubrobacteraceae bacterium]|nr:hypothetical protein [Solirubrobacteraceae bacterium]
MEERTRRARQRPSPRAPEPAPAAPRAPVTVAGNRAAARMLTTGRALARLRIGDDPTTPNARSIGAALRAHFFAIASEKPNSRTWLDMKEKTRKRLETWAREGRTLPWRRGEAPVDPNTYATWAEAVREAYLAEGGTLKVEGPVAEGIEAPAEETAAPEVVVAPPAIASSRGKPLPESEFRKAVREYLAAPPTIDDAQTAEDEIWTTAKGIVEQLGTLTGQLAKNEKGSPHQSQHPKALAKLKLIMVEAKLARLRKATGVDARVIAKLDQQRAVFRKESERKGATHHYR